MCVCVSDRPLLLNLTCHLVLHFLHFPLCSIFSFFLFLPHSYLFISPLLSISLFFSLKHTPMHTHTHTHTHTNTHHERTAFPEDMGKYTQQKTTQCPSRNS